MSTESAVPPSVPEGEQQTIEPPESSELQILPAQSPPNDAADFGVSHAKEGSGQSENDSGAERQFDRFYTAAEGEEEEDPPQISTKGLEGLVENISAESPTSIISSDSISDPENSETSKDSNTNEDQNNESVKTRPKRRSSFRKDSLTDDLGPEEPSRSVARRNSDKSKRLIPKQQQHKHLALINSGYASLHAHRLLSLSYVHQASSLQLSLLLLSFHSLHPNSTFVSQARLG